MTHMSETTSAESDAGLLVELHEKLDSIDRRLAAAQESQIPVTWSTEDIGDWLGLSKYTADQRVVTRDGFPKPIVPAGIQGGQKRWFADEVIDWFRQNRGALPGSGGKPRGRRRQKDCG